MIVFKEAALRAAVYRSDAFQREIGQILQRDRRDVRLYVGALTKAGRLPIDHSNDVAAAIGIEAARILSAVFSRQIKPDSVVRVADRILTMTHQCDVVERNRAAHAVRRLGTFESDLAQSLRGVWEASEGIVAGLPFPPHVVVTWNDGGGVLYGHIKDTREGTTALYSNATIPASPDGAWTFLSTDAVGGSEFTPMPLLGFAECVRDAVRADGDDDGDPA